MIAGRQVYNVGLKHFLQFFKDDVDPGRAGPGRHVEFHRFANRV